jgi:ABC-type microcin C transport system permease subunit YejB
VAALGLQIASVGIRDVILPGDMKDLMNKVTEAKKAAEANLIARREETAAVRSQANTAKLLADNPALMRLRELEVLEKIATACELKIVLGEKGLVERVVLRRHALRNALMPVVAVIGLEFAFLIGGLVVTEQVFNLNGIGKLFVDAISRRDYTLIQGLMLLVAFVYVAVHFFIDLLYAWLDPRITYG